MKQILFIVTAFIAISVLPSCKKCYTCYNMCSVCEKQYFQGWPTDTTLTILVQSDNLSRQYYYDYIDSLESLPNTQWTCRDTTYTKVEKECEPKKRIDQTVADRYEAGWDCVAAE
jgi:hypothetical protein